MTRLTPSTNRPPVGKANPPRSNAPCTRNATKFTTPAISQQSRIFSRRVLGAQPEISPVCHIRQRTSASMIKNTRKRISVSVMAWSSGLTLQELSRAGPAAEHNVNHLDEFRRATGDGSGEVVRHHWCCTWHAQGKKPVCRRKATLSQQRPCKSSEVICAARASA